jgi:hypothetical protein
VTITVTPKLADNRIIPCQLVVPTQRERFLSRTLARCLSATGVCVDLLEQQTAVFLSSRLAEESLE